MMNTDFIPIGERHLKSIRDGVVAEGDAAESFALEAKSDIDPSQKLGVAKIAKFILGAANRMPEVAASHFKGYAVMVLGVTAGDTCGIPAGTEEHDLANSLTRYLGPNGPSWSLSRLAVDPGLEILFVIVDPPRQGHPPYPCHKSYQPAEKADSKHALQDGGVYVRDRTSTRMAKAPELLALHARGASTSTPNVDLTLICEGAALVLTDSDDVLEDIIRIQVDAYREERREAENPSPEDHLRSLVLHQYTSLFAAKRGPQQPIDEAISAGEKRIRDGWAQTMDTLAGSAWNPVIFEIENAAETFLKDPHMVVTIEGAWGVQSRDCLDLDDDEVLPPIEPAQKPWYDTMAVPSILSAWHNQSMEWENSPTGVEIQLRPGQIWSQKPWRSTESDLVVIAREPTAGSLRVTWRLAVDGSGVQFSGETTLPIDASVDMRRLYEIYFDETQQGNCEENDA